MSTPRKEIQAVILDTELEMAVDALSHEDALLLDQLAEDAAQDIDSEALAAEWAALQPRAKKILARKSRRTIPARKIIASIVVTVLLASTVAFVTVDAFRLRILSLVMRTDRESSTIIFLEEHPGGVPVPSYLPDGFQFVERLYAGPETISVYADADENELHISMVPGDSALKIDTEDTVQLAQRPIGKYDGFLVEKNGRTQLVWGDADLEVVFSIFSKTLDLDEMIQIAESFYTEGLQ